MKQHNIQNTSRNSFWGVWGSFLVDANGLPIRILIEAQQKTIQSCPWPRKEQGSLSANEFRLAKARANLYNYW